MIQFYCPDIESVEMLTEDETAHAVRVLRHQPGDIVYVTDGAGHRFECRLLSNIGRRVPIEILSCEDVADYWQSRMTIAVAATKHMDRMEWLVEKCVEIGVDRIIPFYSLHSERKQLKVERLQKIAVSAMKQSLKVRMPQIDEFTPFKSLIEQTDTSGQLFMGYCDKAYPRKELVMEYQPGRDTTLLIGPEGDFTPDEVYQAVNHGFVPVSFGESRLRTETAALYGLQALHIIDNLDAKGRLAIL